MGLANFIGNEAVAVTRQTFTGTTAILEIFTPGTTVAKSGDVLLVMSRASGRGYEITLTSDIDATSTQARFNSVVFDATIPAGSILVYKQQDKWDKINRNYTTIHINAFFSGNNITYSFLGYGGHYNFNIGTTAMTDGGTKGNNFGTKWSWFTALRDCVIEETNIVYSSANNSNADDAIFQLWKWTPNIDSSSALTTNLIKTHNLIGNSNVNYVQKITDTTTYNLSQNEQLVPCFQNTDKANIQWTAEIEILISYYP